MHHAKENISKEVFLNKVSEFKTTNHSLHIGKLSAIIEHSLYLGSESFWNFEAEQIITVVSTSNYSTLMFLKSASIKPKYAFLLFKIKH